MKSDLDIFFEENWIALQDAAQKISNQDDQWEDLLHLCLEDFLAKENVNEIIGSGGGRFYLIRMMLNQYRSSTSWFHKTYRQPVEENNPNFEEEYEDPYEQEEPQPDYEQQIQELLAQLPWYDRNLFEIYALENHSMSSLARATGISRTSISLTIKRVKLYLKNNLNHANIKTP